MCLFDDSFIWHLKTRTLFPFTTSFCGVDILDLFNFSPYYEKCSLSLIIIFSFIKVYEKCCLSSLELHHSFSLKCSIRFDVFFFKFSLVSMVIPEIFPRSLLWKLIVFKSHKTLGGSTYYAQYILSRQHILPCAIYLLLLHFSLSNNVINVSRKLIFLPIK